MPEPSILIHGVRCTEAQAMTLRVALESFASTLQHEGLGDDADGQALATAYLARIAEVRALLCAHLDVLP